MKHHTSKSKVSFWALFLNKYIIKRWLVFFLTLSNSTGQKKHSYKTDSNQWHFARHWPKVELAQSDLSKLLRVHPVVEESGLLFCTSSFLRAAWILKDLLYCCLHNICSLIVLFPRIFLNKLSYIFWPASEIAQIPFFTTTLFSLCFLPEIQLKSKLAIIKNKVPQIACNHMSLLLHVYCE